ncbi:protein tyrosine phosphatase [Nostoc linckia z18]|uniref:Protein tyrosine phosphatase n=6 Tax=Nostoc linckia TaxID=92942 RepID=A0A9Q5Z4Q1_NOSLI|nr:ABC transporter ATP-binding protein [Nostoc linckia]PHK29155.1 protein tyrosine phosphatase [Nostoc linckia z15]PHK39099.1 protein tyrosine phosphatase [Nostoc linckia z16]PHJ56628.1 protein tyrosine phosphatase [Nostoc linckia z2]PHJ71555.1 protein tyrosine phosphatase [Nostoc linckia z4]PHJ75500.1 protein tyrosine phosphatase [Nostoc linckia z6]
MAAKDSKSLRAALPGIARILRRFAPQLSKQKTLLIASFVALMAEIFLHLLEPWPLKFIFDYILVPGFQPQSLGIPVLSGLGQFGLLTALTLGLIAIALLRATAAYFSVVGMALAASHVLTEIRSELYSHLQNLSLSFHHKAKTGDLITRVTSDIERLREVTVMAVLPLIAHSLTLVGMIFVMFWLHWELALIAVAVFPLFVFCTIRLTKRIRQVVRSQRQREGAMAATAAESIGAIKVVQALSLQNMLENSFSRHNRQSLKESAKAQRLAAGLERMVELLVGIATALVLWRGVQLVLKQAITPGDLLVFVNYLRIAFKPMRQLAKYTGQIAKATASGERILDVLDTVPDIRDVRGATEAPPLRGSVRFENVSFAYEPTNRILHNITFEVQPGQRIALVGPSGGGKSTLVSLLLRLYDPIEGQILVDGGDLRQYKLQSIRRQISVVLQDTILFAASVRDNIAYGCLGASDEAIEKAARLANAHDFIMALPEGYETVLGERGATLSGGQRQRISIARAAIRQAAIVILDEPTTGLDNENERAVNEALERLTHKRTTFVVSHNLKAIEQADLIFYIENGRILEQGTHKQLLRFNGRYAAMYTCEKEVGSGEWVLGR